MPDQVAWGLIPGECFSNLLRNPLCRRVWCYVDPDQLSPSDPDNDQSIEQVKADGRNHEQIHGCDMWGVVAQKRGPALRGRPPSPTHVLGAGRLRHRKAELEQLTMNARRTPKCILSAHPSDQCPQIGIDLWPTSKTARFPLPIAAKTGAMPAHEGLGPDDRDGLENRR